jgi:hypothetical protein
VQIGVLHFVLIDPAVTLNQVVGRLDRETSAAQQRFDAIVE